MLVDCADVINHSDSEYQLVPFVNSPKWAPFEVFQLHGPLVKLLEQWSKFVNRRFPGTCAVSSSFRTLNASHASVYFCALFISFLIKCLNDRWLKWTSQNSTFNSLARQYLVNVLNALTWIAIIVWLVEVWGSCTCNSWEYIRLKATIIDC